MFFYYTEKLIRDSRRPDPNDGEITFGQVMMIGSILILIGLAIWRTWFV